MHFCFSYVVSHSG
uniref:Uncharacterized protein n=1 Tax=Anguilla anguilla TaxID=7936 RepID=A0A0E9P5B2_ANGAN